MAWLQVCYKSRMRLFKDRPDILVPGRWRWSPPGAKIVPFAHLFGSYTEDSEQNEIEPPVGESRYHGGTTNGAANPRYLGQHFCGSADLWEHGSAFALRGTPPVDSAGIPACCDATPALFTLDANGEEYDSGDVVFSESPIGGFELNTGSDGF